MQFSEEDLRARFAKESTVALLKMLAHGGEYEESALDIARQEMAKRPAPTHDEMFCDRSSPQLYSLWYGCVLKELFQLSPETAPSVRIVGVDEIELTMKDFVPAMESVTTYRTCWADFLPGSPDSKSAQVTAEVIRPDRFHVWQTAGNDRDEWITIGNETRETLILQLSGPDTALTGSHRAAANQQLLADRFSVALLECPPTRGEFCRHKFGWQFLHVIWESVPIDIMCRLAGWNKAKLSDVQTVHSSMQAWFWPDRRLAKVHISMDENGKSSGFVQFFVAYDHPISIEDPRTTSRKIDRDKPAARLAKRVIDGPILALMSIHWRCWNCENTIERRSIYWALGLRLGLPVEKCLRCGEWVSVGQREWSDLSLLGRAYYFFSPGMIALLVVFGFFISNSDSDEVLPVLVVGLLWLAAIWAVKVVRIMQSNKRLSRAWGE